MTGLPGRRAVEEELARECAQAAREGTPVSAVMMHLDGIARIGEQHGRAAGAEASQRYSRLLRRLTRSSDPLGRLDGDQFLLVLPVWTPEAWRCAERLRAAILQETLEPKWHRCGLSVGIASLEHVRVGDAPALVERAEAALSAAQRAGGNCIRFAPIQETAHRGRRAG